MAPTAHPEKLPEFSCTAASWAWAELSELSAPSPVGVSVGVVWRVVSSDGHPIEGTYTYEVGEGADITTGAPSLSSTPTEAPTGEGADSSDGSAQAQDAAAQENSGGLTGWAVTATVVVALAVIGLLAVMSRRHRKG